MRSSSLVTGWRSPGSLSLDNEAIAALRVWEEGLTRRDDGRGRLEYVAVSLGGGKGGSRPFRTREVFREDF